MDRQPGRKVNLKKTVPHRLAWPSRSCPTMAAGAGYIIFNSVSAISLGVTATPMPAALKASIFA